MTAISLGRFLRGVAIPSDFGSIFTMAVDMPRIMTQTRKPGQPPYFRRPLPETRVTVPGLPHGANSTFQLVTQRDVRLIELRHGTSRLGVLHGRLEQIGR